MKQLVTWHPQSGSRERWTLVLSLLFLCFIQSRTPAHGMILASLRQGPPISVNLIKRILQRCTQRFISQVTLELSIDHRHGPSQNPTGISIVIALKLGSSAVVLKVLAARYAPLFSFPFVQGPFYVS